MQQDWNIRSRAETCAVTGRAFGEGEIFHTDLHREGEGFLRTDLCEEAWRERQSDPSAPQPFSSWKSKFEPPAPPPPEPLPRDDAEGMLRRLLESDDPSHANARYLLAVMLERKRLLRPRPAGDPDNLIYEHSRTGEIFVIRDPHLSLSDLTAVQEEVTALLAGLSAPGNQTPDGAETPGAVEKSPCVPGDSVPTEAF